MKTPQIPRQCVPVLGRLFAGKGCLAKSSPCLWDNRARAPGPVGTQSWAASRVLQVTVLLGLLQQHLSAGPRSSDPPKPTAASCSSATSPRVPRPVPTRCSFWCAWTLLSSFFFNLHPIFFRPALLFVKTLANPVSRLAAYAMEASYRNLAIALSIPSPSETTDWW